MMNKVFMMCHPNGKGTGSMLAMKINFNLHDEIVNFDTRNTEQNKVSFTGSNQNGSVEFSISKQITVGCHCGVGADKPSTFDTEHKLSVNLSFKDISEILGVIRGETESIQDGHGLVFRKFNKVGEPSWIVRLSFRHIIEPVPGYVFEAFKRDDGSDRDEMYRFLLTYPEALGFSVGLEHALSRVMFG